MEGVKQAGTRDGVASTVAATAVQCQGNPPAAKSVHPFDIDHTHGVAGDLASDGSIANTAHAEGSAPMKMTFIVHNEYQTERVMQLLKAQQIDYYTRWDHATGKGHGTEPHLGTGSYGSRNAVMMVAFEDEVPLTALIAAIEAANEAIVRPADRIRLFQLPLDRIV
jgi:hypothetical protein